ncbi:hypothetical protein FH972_009151 [Carpinus fangiana]|uniref:Uncharacterized protein n=1 Tax=Carpinus fangiana TaxID=176857 RepID=A0A5N6R2L0_9ROSI|nr:hypothetical protein FH972_009151 [Carpinus fangiana]
MQAGSMFALSPAFNFHPPASGYNSELADKLSGDFGAKLKLESGDMEDKEASKMEALDEKKLVDGGENSEEEEDEEEFSFACVNPDGSPISADDAFADGQIRPIFPLFNGDFLLADAYDGESKPKEGSSSTPWPPLRKFFVKERDPTPSSSTSESDEREEGAPAGPFCEWSGKAELSKKSNSTGFSKIWRFRDLVRRSNSDGHDAFVFLNHSSANAKPSSEPTTEAKKNEGVEKKEKVGKVEVKRVVRSAKTKTTTASSVHEAHYVKNRAQREGDKRKSYLPYRVGFFTNVNGLSRNVHPF